MGGKCEMEKYIEFAKEECTDGSISEGRDVKGGAYKVAFWKRT